MMQKKQQKHPNLWLQLGINPTKTLDQLLSGPVHRRPAVLCTLKVGRQISIHVFAPKVSRVRIRLSILKTIAGQRRLPGSHRLQVPLRRILYFGQVHPSSRLALLVPRVSLIYRQSSIMIGIKILEVFGWQASSLPILQCDFSISVANEIQLVVRSSKVWRV